MLSQGRTDFDQCHAQRRSYRGLCGPGARNAGCPRCHAPLSRLPLTDPPDPSLPNHIDRDLRWYAGSPISKYLLFSVSISDSHLPLAIISADKASRGYEASRHPEEGFKDAEELARQEAYRVLTPTQKAMNWGKENRYAIVGGSWVGCMALSLGLVAKNPYLSTQQKIVQSRVYAQALTIAVLIATAAFEVGDQRKGEGRYETIQVIDPNDPEHKHLIDKKVHKESYQGEDQWKGRSMDSWISILLRRR